MKLKGKVDLSFAVPEAISFDNPNEKEMFGRLVKLAESSFLFTMERLALERIDFETASNIVAYIYGAIASASSEHAKKKNSKKSKSTKKGK